MGTDSRREQLLAATAAVISRRGFAETRVSDIAAEAGVSVGLVVYYFDSRERLLVEALRYSEDCFYAAVSAHLTGLSSAREKLQALIRVTCSPEPVLGLPAGWSLWFELWAQAVHNPSAAKDRAELDERWRAVVVDIVHQGQAVGELGPMDADRFAQTFTALLDGLGIQVVLDDQTVTAERAMSLAGALCDLMLVPGPSISP